MLNFTHIHGEIRGEFNGRFVFHASPNSKPLPLRTISDLADSGITDSLDETLRHEYLHYKVFEQSMLGQELIGHRFDARKKFAANVPDAVTQYYVARTCYFVTSFAAHEKVVNALEQPFVEQSKLIAEIQLTTVPTAERTLILEADERAKKLQQRLGFSRAFVDRKVDWIKGRLATREYGLQYYDFDKDGQPFLAEAAIGGATRGVINSAFRSNAHDSAAVRAFKLMRRKTNTEGGRVGTTKEKMATWLCLKLNAELATLRNISKIDPQLLNTESNIAQTPEDYFHAGYLIRLGFVMRHILRDEPEWSILALANLFFEIGDSTPSASVRADYVRRLSNQDHELLYYFFCHGN